MKVIIFVFALITTHLAVMGFSADEEPSRTIELNHTCPSTRDGCCNTTDKFSVTGPAKIVSSDYRILVTPGCSPPYNISFSVTIECEADFWIAELNCLGINMGSYNATCEENVNENGECDCPMQVGHIYTGRTWPMTVPSGMPSMDVNCTLAYSANGEKSMGLSQFLLRIGEYGCPYDE